MKENAKKYFDQKIEKMNDADKRLFIRSEITEEKIKDIKKIHLTGVCGTAMGSLAGLLVQAGYEVSGSDTSCYPPMSDMISTLGIKFCEGFSEENIKDKDITIVANMFGPDNIEAKFVRENNLPHLSMAEAINKFFIKDRTSIVISGTHGKTTTTGMCAHVFTSAGKNPGFLVGGVMVKSDGGPGVVSFNFGFENINKTNAEKNFSKHFIIEGDEYDTSYFDKAPKFLHYSPKIAVVTSLEFDHADIYTDLNDYRQSFIFLAESMPEDGLLILNSDWAEVKALANYTKAKVLFYGLESGNNITAENISIDETGQHFDLIVSGNNLGRLTIKLFGKYNLVNALSVCAMGLNESLSFEQIKKGLETFNGMKRRQEIISEEKNITIIDDFAHHPTAVRETLLGIRDRFKNRRIITLFEPRSVTSRKKLFEKDYGNSFLSSNILFLSMPALRVVDNPEDFINGDTVVSEVNKNGTKAFCVKNSEEVLKLLMPELKPGDVVVIMSNGSFDGIHKKIIKSLK